MESYKEKYNKLLKRYYNGCKYIENNPNEYDKYIGELLKIQKELSDISLEYNIQSPNTLEGFND